MSVIDHYEIFHSIASMEYDDAALAVETEVNRFLQVRSMKLDGLTSFKDRIDIVFSLIRDQIHQIICVDLNYCDKKNEYDMYIEVYPIVLGVLVASSPVVVAYAALASFLCSHYLPIMCAC